jgi:hypothetical protein
MKLMALLTGNSIAASLVLLTVSLLMIIQAAIVLSWINKGYVKEATQSNRQTARSLSILSLVAALLGMLVSIFRLACKSPFSMTPTGMVACGLAGE